MLWLLVPTALPAQESGAQSTPLQKTDVVGMLIFGDQTEPENAEAIRTHCLTFSPTTGDLQDFRRLAAGDAVMQAIRECAGIVATGDESPPSTSSEPELAGMGPSRAEGAAPPRDSGTARSSVSPERSGTQSGRGQAPVAGESAPREDGLERGAGGESAPRDSRSSEARDPVEIRLMSPSDGARATAGDTLELRFQARQGGKPVTGIRIVALGARSARTSGAAPAASVTGADGEARLEVVAPTRAGEYPVQIAAEARLADTLDLQLEVDPGPAARVLATPRTLRLQGQVGELDLRFLLLDQYENPLAGARVRAVVEDGPLVREGVTDADGRVAFRFPKRQLEPGMTITLHTGQQELLSVPVRK